MLSLLRTFSFILFISSNLWGNGYEELLKPHNDEPQSSIDGIDAVYVINLDVRPEKWHRIESILCANDISHSRFSAVFGLDFDVDSMKKYGRKHLRPGQVGCMMSHLSIYADALKRGLNTIWVMEDDTEIKRNPKILTKLIQELTLMDPNWDVLYTDLDFVKKDGTYVRSAALPIDKKRPFARPLNYYTFRKNVSRHFQVIRSRYGTGSMILSRQGMQKILEHFLTFDDVLWPIDIEIHYVPDLKQYGLINPVATNAHFSFNFSDTGRANLSKYYLINDEHVNYLEKKHREVSPIIRNWLQFLGLKKTVIN